MTRVKAEEIVSLINELVNVRATKHIISRHCGVKTMSLIEAKKRADEKEKRVTEELTQALERLETT